MAENALDCIICGTQLKNVFEDATNQPDGGIVATSFGNYGSTVFDPMNGTFLEFNICDTCITTAGEQGRVHTGRRTRPVYLRRIGIIGETPAEYNPEPWTAQHRQNHDTLTIDAKNLDPLPNNITLTAGLTPELLHQAHEEAKNRHSATSDNPSHSATSDNPSHSATSDNPSHSATSDNPSHSGGQRTTDASTTTNTAQTPEQPPERQP